MPRATRPWFSIYNSYATILLPRTWQAWLAIGVLIIVGIGGPQVIQMIVADSKARLWVNFALWFVEGLVFAIFSFNHSKARGRRDGKPGHD